MCQLPNVRGVAAKGYQVTRCSIGEVVAEMSMWLTACEFSEEYKQVSVNVEEMRVARNVRASWSSNQLVNRNRGGESSARKTSNILREANNDQQRKQQNNGDV